MYDVILINMLRFLLLKYCVCLQKTIFNLTV